MSEDKEVSAPNAEAKNLLGIIKYIAEKEANLNKYSDKLREAINQIADNINNYIIKVL